MNFNLMSPEDNGHDFTVRFRDPISIKPNSKISLNFLEMSREGVIVFESDQTFTINFEGEDNETLPELIPNNSNLISGTFKSGVIPAGTYEYAQLQAKLQELLEGVISDINGDFQGFQDRYQAVTLTRESTTSTLALGLALKPSDLTAMTLNTTHQHDVGTSTGYLYVSANDTGTYDNYALVDEVLDCYRADDEDAEFDSYAYFETVLAPATWTGSHFCGLYSLDYAEGIAPAPTRTEGDNPPQLITIAGNDVPACFIGLNFDQASNELHIVGAKDTSNNLYTQWDSMNQEINDYEMLDRVPIGSAFGDTTSLQFAWAFSVVNDGAGAEGIRWKIIADPTGARTVVYDSFPRRTNIPRKFFVGTDITYDNETAIFSQMSLGFMLSCENDAPDGWNDTSSLTEFFSGSASEPGIVVKAYTISATPELEKVLKLPEDSGTNVTLYFPNAKPSSAKIAKANVDLNWKADNYSIFINLPANAYKNVRLARDGGFKKSILANVPSPFLTGTVNIHEFSDQQQVTSLYQPYSPIVYSLQNNEIQTNSFEIKIVHMNDETPATEIENSVVNFTIHNE